MNSKILKELQKRIEAEEHKFTIEAYCFDKQLKFIQDPAKFKTAVCSRRAGKSISCAADLISTAIEFPKTVSVYITLSRITAKRIIWRALLDIIEEFKMEVDLDRTDLSIRFRNGSIIYVSGAKDETEIEKLRGLAIKKVYIDEAQSFRPYIQKLVDDVIVPALYDYDGSLILIGTPGPVPSGYFFDACHSDQWSNHFWTMLDNPWIEKKSGRKVEDLLAAERKRRGITEDDPTYMRESLGLWVHDTNALVYKFNPKINIYSELPKGKLTYVFGIDLGWHDGDAIAVMGYSHETNQVYLVEEDVLSKQSITDLINKIERLRTKYQPVKMVIDSGGLGKKIQEELRSRHQIPMDAADKVRKFEFIELMNDDLRNGALLAFGDSRFEQDSLLVQWDRSTPGKLAVSDRYHSDICDAVLYAWRECRHYIKENNTVVPGKFNDKYGDFLEQKLMDKAEEDKDKPWWDPGDPDWDDIVD